MTQKKQKLDKAKAIDEGAQPPIAEEKNVGYNDASSIDAGGVSGEAASVVTASVAEGNATDSEKKLVIEEASIKESLTTSVAVTQNETADVATEVKIDEVATISKLNQYLQVAEDYESYLLNRTKTRARKSALRF